jgi:hypothetical protein
VISPSPQIAIKRLPAGIALHSLKDWGDSAMHAKWVKQAGEQIIINENDSKYPSVLELT